MNNKKITYIALSIIGMITLCFFKNRNTLKVDPVATTTPLPEIKSEEQILEDMQRETDDERFRLSLNGAPIIDKTTNMANIYIQNSSENTFAIRVIITLAEVILFESAKLLPGEQVLSAEFSNIPNIGEYDAQAIVQLYDLETGDILGDNIIGIKLTIK